MRRCEMCKLPFRTEDSKPGNSNSKRRTCHLLPAGLKKRKLWFNNCGLTQFPTGKYRYICSDHFKPEDYSFKPSGLRILRKDAVPSFVKNEEETESDSDSSTVFTNSDSGSCSLSIPSQSTSPPAISPNNSVHIDDRETERTPDEIKTRIRNLKCLYHRIKRTMQSGSGIGTVDPDWPHYKAMDDILSKKNAKKDNPYKDNIFDGPRCEDIKQEIDDIDIYDDMESYTTTSMADSEYEEETTHLPALTPAPPKETPREPPKEKDGEKVVRSLPQIKPVPTLLPNYTTIPVNQTIKSQPNIGIRAANGSHQQLPFPLLILNGMPQNIQQQHTQQEKKEVPALNVLPTPGKSSPNIQSEDVSGILKSLLDVQKENLEVAKQRLELEKQKLEFERLIGSQLLTIVPMFGGLLQRVAFPNDGDSSSNSKRKRNGTEELDFLKSSKILRTVLQQGIKKYMMEEDEEEEEQNDGVSENEDSGINNDENSK